MPLYVIRDRLVPENCPAEVRAAASPDAPVTGCAPENIIEISVPAPGGPRDGADVLTGCYLSALDLAMSAGYAGLRVPLLGAAEGYAPEDVAKAAGALYSVPGTDSLDIYISVPEPSFLKLRPETEEDIDRYVRANFSAPVRTLCSITEDSEAGDAIPNRMRLPRKIKEAARARRESPRRRIAGNDSGAFEAARYDAIPAAEAVKEFRPELEDGFSETLLGLIDRAGLDDVACYKRANVSKQTWHKIVSDPTYKPSKKTVISFAIALELDYRGTQKLLSTAGFTLSKSSMFDVIIEYFIRSGNYDMFEIDGTLFKYDQETLASIK